MEAFLVQERNAHIICALLLWINDDGGFANNGMKLAIVVEHNSGAGENRYTRARSARLRFRAVLEGGLADGALFHGFVSFSEKEKQFIASNGESAFSPGPNPL